MKKTKDYITGLVDGITFKDYLYLRRYKHEDGITTIDLGLRSGLSIEWNYDEEALEVSGKERQVCAFGVLCHCDLGHEEWFPLMEAMMELPPEKEIEDFNDGINYTAPTSKGLYFIGETHFNPFTNEKFYWVKIGKSTNLKKRMNQYNTCCPMLWRIGFSDKYDEEEFYHDWLYEHCEATCNHNEEWFLVNRETYLEMCEKGFAYFD